MKFRTHPPLVLQVVAFELPFTLRKSRSVAALPTAAPGLETSVTGEHAGVPEAESVLIAMAALGTPAEIGTSYNVGVVPVLPQT
jgi:hypothetical protein